MGRTEMAAYVMHGPLVLAKSTRLGCSEKAVFIPGTINGDTGWKAAAKPLKNDDRFWGRWELTLEKDGARRIVEVCDFASAAPDGDWHNAFSIWF